MLVGALIDSAFNAHYAGEASKTVEPIRKEIPDIDFRTEFFDTLQRTLPTWPLLRVASITPNTSPLTPESLADARDRAPENTFLAVGTGYYLSADFSTFIVMTTAVLTQKGREEPLYRSRYVYMSAPVPGDKTGEDAARIWAADHGAAIRAAMREGIDETMSMLTIDLAPNGSGRPQPGSPPPARTAPLPPAAAPRVAGATPPAQLVAATTPPPPPTAAPTPAAQLVAATTPPPPPTAAPTLPAQPLTAAPRPAPLPVAAATLPAPPPTAAAAPPAQPLVAPPQAAPPAAATTPPAPSPAAAASPRSLLAEAALPASTAAPAPRAVPPVVKRRDRKIARRADGVMFSAPRENHPAEPIKR